MEARHIAVFPLPCYGRIPNFVDADAAAAKLQDLGEWKNASTVFVNPDAAQSKVRENVLRAGKVLVMASPRLTRGFIVLTPEAARGKESLAATIKGAFTFGKTVTGFSKPDLVVTGSVAVDVDGNRLGKGHGYGDREIRIVRDRFGRVPVVTTVHDVQVVDKVPVSEQDEKVDVIVTPTKVIRVNWK